MLIPVIQQRLQKFKKILMKDQALIKLAKKSYIKKIIINEKKLDKTFIKLSKHYDLLVRKYGDNVKSSQQSTSISRDKRLKLIKKY